MTGIDSEYPTYGKNSVRTLSISTGRYTSHSSTGMCFSTTPKLFAFYCKTLFISFLLNEYFVTTPFFKLTKLTKNNYDCLY